MSVFWDSESLSSPAIAVLCHSAAEYEVLEVTMQTQRGSFKISSWAEQAGDELGGPQLTRVRAGVSYQGVIQGEGAVEFLMYSPDGRVTHFVGLEYVNGRIGGLTGRAVFQHAGTFADGVAKSKWFVVPGSGTDGLVGLSGEGSYGEQPGDAEHDGSAPLSFSFRFTPDAEPSATPDPAGV